MEPIRIEGHSKESVLIAYVLAEFSNFQGQEMTERIKIRHMFECAMHGLIAHAQLQAIAEQCYTHMTSAVSALGLAMNFDFPTFTRIADKDAKHQTLFLLSNYGKFPLSIVAARLYKTVKQCTDRIRYVVSRLEANGMFDDGPCSRDTQSCCIVQQECFSIIPPPKYDIGILKARMMRQRKKQLSETLKLRMEKVRLGKQVKKMEELLMQEQTMAEVDSDCEDADEVVDGELDHKDILQELNQHSKIDKHARTYSQKLLSFCQLLMLTSRKTYALIQQVLPVPSMSCLKNHFSSQLSDTKEKITRPEMIHDHIAKLSPITSTNPMIVTLAADAFAFQTFNETCPLRHPESNEVTVSNAFAFMCIPLDASARPAVVHLMTKNNGSFDANVMTRFSEIAGIYKGREVKVMFAATDGDRFLSASHDEFFENYVSEYRHDFSFLIGKLYESLLQTNTTMPIADPLHFAKNMRGKILDHSLAVVFAEDVRLINTAALQSVLDLGLTLADKSRLGRMRDFYATSLFTLANVDKLMQEKQHEWAFLLLPYSCLFTTLYSTNIATETRLFFVHLAYLSVLSLMDQAGQLVEHFGDIKYRYGKNTRAIVFAEPSYAKRMLHTCLALGIAINFGPAQTRLDAIGTHLLENAIGIARSVSNSCQFSRITTAFANGEMRKELARKIGVQLYVSRRINDGGAKVQTNSRDGLVHPRNWDPRDIVSLFLEACQSATRDSSSTELGQFAEEFHAFVQSINTRQLNRPSAVANCSILQRNICFNHGAKT